MSDNNLQNLIDYAKEQNAHKFKDLFSRVLKDRIVTRINDERKSVFSEGRAGEKAFYDMHNVKKHEHPVASDDNFSGGTTRGDYRLADQGQDVQGDENPVNNARAAMKHVNPYSGEEDGDEDFADDEEEMDNYRDFDVGAR